MVNIVVAVDESEESMRACEWACKHLLSAQTDIQQSCNFILLHVQPTPCVSTGPAYVPSDQVFELLELQTKRTSQRILKRALNICSRYGVKAETHVVIGEAKERICEAAAKLGAHFLVVGSHGHGIFTLDFCYMVSDMQMQQREPTPLFCDNQGMMKLAKNPVFHERTKHVDTHCHYIRQLVEEWTNLLSILTSQ